MQIQKVGRHRRNRPELFGGGGVAGPALGWPKSRSLLLLAQAGALSKQWVDAPRLVCVDRWGRWSGEQ